MSWLSQFYVRILIAAVLMLAGFFVAKRLWSRVGIKSLAGYYLVRAIAVYLIYECIGIVPSDVSIWGDYYSQKILTGQIPGIDFLTFYFLGFHYVTAGAFYLFSYFGIALVFMVAELMAVLFLYKILVRVYTIEIAKKTVILYLLSPFAVIVSFLSAQDEPLMILAICSYMFFTLCCDSRAGRILSCLASISLTKVTILFYLLPTSVLGRFRGAFLVSVLFIGWCMAMFLFGINPFNLQVETGGVVADRMLLGNFWSLLPIEVPSFIQIGVFLLLSGGWSLCLLANLFYYTATEKVRLSALMIMMIGIELIFSLTYHTVFNAYILPAALFVICAFVAKKGTLLTQIIISLWSLVACFKDPFLIGIDNFNLQYSEIVSICVTVVYITLTITILALIYLSYCELFRSPMQNFRFIFGTEKKGW